MKELATAAEVIEQLGGPTAIGRLVGRSAQSAVNWRTAGRLPSDTFLILQAELRSRDMSAPPAVWGILEPTEVAS